MTLTHTMLAILLGTAPLQLTFDQLHDNDFQEQTVQLRGFAYQSADGNWILSSDPQLKSCCVGSAAKAKQQVALSGQFESLPKAQAIIMEGVMHVDSTRESGLYTLRHAHAVGISSFPWHTVALGAIALGGVVFIYQLKRKKS